jgi:hypothetical protein
MPLRTPARKSLSGDCAAAPSSAESDGVENFDSSEPVVGRSVSLSDMISHAGEDERVSTSIT